MDHRPAAVGAACVVLLRHMCAYILVCINPVLFGSQGGVFVSSSWWCVPCLQDLVFSGVAAVGIAIGFIVTAANAADFQNRGGNGGPRDSAAATSVSLSVHPFVRL